MGLRLASALMPGMFTIPLPPLAVTFRELPAALPVVEIPAIVTLDPLTITPLPLGAWAMESAAKCTVAVPRPANLIVVTVELLLVNCTKAAAPLPTVMSSVAAGGGSVAGTGAVVGEGPAAFCAATSYRYVCPDVPVVSV